MTGSKPTPAELLAVCDIMLAVHAYHPAVENHLQLNSWVRATKFLATALKEHLSAPPAVGRDDVPTLDIIFRWYGTLRPRAKESISIENLHALSKTIQEAIKSPTSPTIVRTSSAVQIEADTKT